MISDARRFFNHQILRMDIYPKIKSPKHGKYPLHSYHKAQFSRNELSTGFPGLLAKMPKVVTISQKSGMESELFL